MESAVIAEPTPIEQLRRQLADLMRIEEYTVIQPPDTVISFRGQVYGDTETAFEHMAQRFAEHGYTASLRDQPGGGHEAVAVKGVLERKPGRTWINVALFLATLFSVLYIGARYTLGDANLLTGESLPADVLLMPLTHLHWGLPFAGTLLGILLTHELSHYFVARRYGSPVSLPYFIPMPPPNILGTMGAVIVQRAPIRNRKALFDIGVAGPLGGLIVAIPLLVLGLVLSNVGPPPPHIDTALQEGNSLLYVALKYLVFGRILPSNGEDVWLHPVAFAAWAGLLVTMINLIPVGQLDGGHVSYALLGRRAKTLGYVLVGAMVAWGGWLSFIQGNQAGGFWMMWGFLNLIINPRHPPPLDDATRLDGRRVALGLAVLVIFILLFMPAPLREIRL